MPYLLSYKIFCRRLMKTRKSLYRKRMQRRLKAQVSLTIQRVSR